MIGNLGHLSIIIAFVAIFAAIFSYFKENQASLEKDKKSWKQVARGCFFLHGIAVISAIGILFFILFDHRYEYDYAWQHVANDLPVYFIISCFWEGQEGSFLIWTFWNVLIGFFLIRSSKKWETKTMMVFCAVQLFLVSMVLGVHISDNLKIGNSPFMLLKDVSDSEIFKTNPNFIPQDGTGLNPLLQNIWMAIHPPVIFFGFALSSVPFCLAMAALWQKKPQDFIYKSSPWILASVGVLGAGIVMGAYWAYETLNFGGYWNWDPVENAVFVPWLALLAATHGMVLFRRKEKGLPLTLALSMAGFILVVYSTFLTRSGILGETSVHAFTDLGLSGQLLIFLLSFVLAAVAMFLYGRKQMTETEPQSSFLSLEFWMMLGICLFCLSAFQVLLPTSIPVFNVLLEMLGIEKNLAPPADQVTFYSQFQIWFGVAFCMVSGLGQIFYWKRIGSKKTLENEIGFPIIISLILTSLFVFLAKTQDISYIFLIGSAIYLIAVSLQLLIPLVKNIQRTSLGGILAHLGMAIMLLGFVYSAGHQKILSKNMAINAPESNLPVHTVRNNLFLNQNVPKRNQGFDMIYQGAHYKDRESGILVPIGKTLPTWRDHQKIVQETVPNKGILDKGDTISIDPENIYYNIKVVEGGGTGFTLSPRMQNNPQMGYIASPDIQSYFTKDIYTHVTNFPDPEKIKWNEPVKRSLYLGESFEVQGLNVTLKDVKLNEDPLGIPASKHDFPLEATVKIKDQYGSYLAKPLYHIDKGRSVRLFPDEIKALGTKVFLSQVNPETRQYELTVMTSQRDWITIESIEMPFISLVWLGAILMTIGIGLSFYFRLVEAKESQIKEEYLLEEAWPKKVSHSMELS